MIRLCVFRVDLSMCNCVRRGIMLMIVCDVPLCVIVCCRCFVRSCHLLLVSYHDVVVSCCVCSCCMCV